MIVGNSTITYARLALGSIFMIAVSFSIVNEIKRFTMIKHTKDTVRTLGNEIDVYKNLGFDSSDMVVQILQSRIDRAQKTLTRIAMRRNVIFNSPELKSIKSAHIQELVRINKTIADNYRQEIQTYMHLAMPDPYNVVQEARNRLAYHMVEIAELESKLKSKQLGNAHVMTFNQKMQRMIEGSQELLELYKMQIADSIKIGLLPTDPRVVFVRDCITQKAGEIAALETKLL